MFPKLISLQSPLFIKNQEASVPKDLLENAVLDKALGLLFNICNSTVKGGKEVRKNESCVCSKIFT